MGGKKIRSFLQALGRPIVSFVINTGYFTRFVAVSVYNCFMPPFYLKLFGKQFLNMGFYSLPVVGLTTLFAGMVIAIQTYSGISKYGAESVVATVVLISVTRELAPVLSALAGLIVMPLLVLFGDIIGIFGGYVVSIYKLDFNPANYINNTMNNLQLIDVTTGVVKACVFGFIIAIMGCYHGYRSKGGAQGVGEATTNAVVSSSILILIFNYLITEIIFSR